MNGLYRRWLLLFLEDFQEPRTFPEQPNQEGRSADDSCCNDAISIADHDKREADIECSVDTGCFDFFSCIQCRTIGYTMKQYF